MEVDGYMLPYQRDLPFSCCHGRNLTKTTNFEMKWDQRRHDGVCVSSRPIRKGDRYKISIHGDGHVLVGLIDKPPSLKDLHSGSLSLKAADLAVYQIRIKKYSSVVIVEYVQKKTITLQQGDRSSAYHKMVKEKDSCYVCVELLFGNVQVTLGSIVPTNNKTEDLLWSTKSGLNLQRSPDGNMMTLKHLNPLSLCGTQEPLQPNKTVKLTVEILPNCQYGYLSFAVSNRPPEILQLNCPQRFYSDEILPHLSDFQKIKIKGSSDIYIVWDGGRNIKYFIASKEEKRVKINNVDITFPLYLIIEMFRIRVSIATVPAARPPVAKKPNMKITESFQTFCTNTLQGSNQDCNGNQRPTPKKNSMDNGYLTVVAEPPNACIPRDGKEGTPFSVHLDNEAGDLGNQLRYPKGKNNRKPKKQTQTEIVSKGCTGPTNSVPCMQTGNTNPTGNDYVATSLAMIFPDTDDPDLTPNTQADLPHSSGSLTQRSPTKGTLLNLREPDIQIREDDQISHSSITSNDLFGEGNLNEACVSSNGGFEIEVEKRVKPRFFQRRPSILIDIDLCRNSFSEEEWLETLHCHQSYLKENLNSLPVACILQKEHYISVREYHTLEKMTDQSDQTMFFIDLLRKRPHLSQQVLTALERAGQRCIAEHLMRTF